MEIGKGEKIIEDFEFLIEDSNIGFYNRCEIIEILGFKGKEIFNIFTLVVFENSVDTEYNTDGKFLNIRKDNTILGHTDIKWGIFKRRILKEKMREVFLNLIKNGEFKVSNSAFKNKDLLFRKKYVPSSNEYEKIKLNEILKNNFSNGSYIIEGFDIEKRGVDFLMKDPVALNDFSQKISSILPIKIGNVSDRLGNIIFQFPINLFTLEKMNIEGKLKIKLDYNFELRTIPDLEVIVFNKFEDITYDSQILTIKKEVILDISIDEEINLKIINKKNNQLLYSEIFGYMRGLNLSSNICQPQKRIFNINDKLQEVEVGIIYKHNISMNNKTEGISKLISNRKYEQELLSLEKSKFFIQYNGNDHEKALEDIRILIKRYSKEGIYLWDPFLSAIDIKKTLYFVPYSNVPLKAITNLKTTKKFNKETVLKNYISEFEKEDMNYLFLNLEVRTRCGNYGQDFHDRFIIFPLEQPKVWSLGTSVNSLGKSHHILQEVKNAQHILNAFNKLWKQLDGEECLLWKTMK